MILEKLNSKKGLIMLIVAVLAIFGLCVVYSVVLSSTDSGNGNVGSALMTLPTNVSAHDYKPCNNSNGNVVCNLVLLEEVEKVFRRTSSPRLASIKLTLQPYIFSEKLIPEDVFGTKRILDIWIEHSIDSFVNRSLTLRVDPNAFRSTKFFTNKFTINIIDCSVLNLDFFSGFDKLSELRFLNVYNIQHCLPSLPPLPQLAFLVISRCTGMNELIYYPDLNKGLKRVMVIGDIFVNDKMQNSNHSINDVTVDRLMNWLLLSSAKTLEGISIVYMNQVTRVPHKIAAFKALNKLRLHDNNISIIKSGALSFSAPVSKLDMDRNGIKKIEPGAFQGDFKDAVVALNNNSLIRFDESVFRPILQQMASGKGSISVQFGNQVDCRERTICHLSWLRRFKAGFEFNLNCSNGTSFTDLQPAGFNHCS